MIEIIIKLRQSNKECYLLLLIVFLNIPINVRPDGIFLFDTSLNLSGIQQNVDTHSDIAGFLPFLLTRLGCFFLYVHYR